MNQLRTLSEQLQSCKGADLWYQLEDLGDILIKEHQKNPPVDSDVLGILVQYLEHKDSNISETTSRILKQIPEINVAKLLIPKINHDNIELRNHVVEILKSIGEENHILNEIKNQLSQKDEDVIIFTLDVMNEISDLSCIDELSELTQHENENIKIRAIECLGNIQDEAARKLLSKIILNQSSEDTVLAAALLSLGHSKDQTYIDVILNCPETSQAITAYKCKSLAEMASQKSADYLCKKLINSDTSSFVKRKALAGLAELVDKNYPEDLTLEIGLNELKEYLNSGHKDLIKSSVAIIGKMKYDGYLEILSKYFNSTSSDIRLQALLSIEDDYSPKASHIRRLMEHDSNPDIRLLALKGRIKEQGRK